MTNTETAATARPAYRVLGTTDDVTVCELCGRTELHGTTVLAVLDADGDTGERVYFGSSCGAKATGWTVREIRTAARAADLDAKRARFDAHQSELAAAGCLLAPTMCRQSGIPCAEHS